MESIDGGLSVAAGFASRPDGFVAVACMNPATCVAAAGPGLYRGRPILSQWRVGTPGPAECVAVACIAAGRICINGM